MAPKKLIARAKKAATKAVELFTTAPEKKAQQALATLEKDELTSRASGLSAITRQLRRRSSEQAVNKILRDNFGGLSPAMTDDKLNEQGNSLRHQLLLDRGNPQIRMGLKYYAAMRADFSDELSAASQLKALGPTEPIDAMVKASIMGVEAHPVDLTPMHALFCEQRPLSQRNVVVVLKGLLKLRTASIMPQLAAFVEGLRWLQMNGAPKPLPTRCLYAESISTRPWRGTTT
jgi:hypothetical protein